MLRTVTKEETVQYALAVLDDMVTGMPLLPYKSPNILRCTLSAALLTSLYADDPSSAKYFHSSGSYSSHQPNPYEILLRSACMHGGTLLESHAALHALELVLACQARLLAWQNRPQACRVVPAPPFSIPFSPP